MKNENIYETEKDSFSDLVKEKKETKKDWYDLALNNLVKAQFAIYEATGGGANANENSKHAEDRALALMKKAFSELTGNRTILEFEHDKCHRQIQVMKEHCKTPIWTDLQYERATALIKDFKIYKEWWEYVQENVFIESNKKGFILRTEVPKY